MTTNYAWQNNHPLMTLSTSAATRMQQKLDNLAKPVRGLGRLEDLMIHLAEISHDTTIDFSRRELLVFAADHGVAAAGVSATPQEVTRIQADNMITGTTTVAAMCRASNCPLTIVDVGLKTAPNNPNVISRVVSRGTHNLAITPAMTVDEAAHSIDVGYQIAATAVNDRHAQLLLIGELGIGNTTAASAITACCLQVNPNSVVGNGSNISEQRREHKVAIVNQAIARLFDKDDALSILANVGGFEIGAMTGAILYAGQHGVPLVIDGFISYAALLLVEKIQPGIQNHIIPSHASYEAGTKTILKSLSLTPYFNLNLCVGEGTGAVLLLPWIDLMSGVLKNTTTLTQSGFHFTK
ncbi:nicotinate-nucleotide--dimethylbenzimidazole phosphoribosyltransferase [Furfurilactobacillus siliginis]|uniref:Nicotinate-nucleotide--dimethylbenzimidazole phosphoribosyltransferase n=1 Tax=Furfurilactobacillus siliginis TaxID=348151 RepID=A0A0R2L4E3_9LACO|nr:nicotinate-nucleotide--dimethylbenzimidazole phosphoribosyltransferase [Furfurilactobacillus siliginis]KRN96632.1 nicotinate-nucleotide-dimethylbenzimidazole phosphoribosyltransferase CobT [Furfurilactobacillus siliginis]GEK28801.1 nicotinate-nucleotide--dimethylbenzimidazole phosphoribosyltransferase [Furfurilactobacillus siliginis]